MVVDRLPVVAGILVVAVLGSGAAVGVLLESVAIVRTAGVEGLEVLVDAFWASGGVLLAVGGGTGLGTGLVPGLVPVVLVVAAVLVATVECCSDRPVPVGV